MSTPIRKRIGYYKQQEAGAIDVNISEKDFSDESYVEYKQCIKIVFELQPIIMLHEATLRNYSELEASILSSEQKFKDKTLKNGSQYLLVTEGVTIIQRINNFLASASSFLSVSEVKLEKCYGKGSNEEKTWNQFRNEMHKDSFAYQFIYDLRNFSQHYQLPISTLKIKGSNLTTDDKDINTEIFISRDALLNSGFSWKKSVEDELEKQDESFDLSPLLREYMTIIHRLLDKYLEVNKTRFKEGVEYVTTLRNTLKIPNDTTPVIFLGDTATDKPVPEHTEQIPVELLHWILERYVKTNIA